MFHIIYECYWMFKESLLNIFYIGARNYFSKKLIIFMIPRLNNFRIEQNWHGMFCMYYSRSSTVSSLFLKDSQKKFYASSINKATSFFPSSLLLRLFQFCLVLKVYVNIYIYECSRFDIFKYCFQASYWQKLTTKKQCRRKDKKYREMLSETSIK